MSERPISAANVVIEAFIVGLSIDAVDIATFQLDEEIGHPSLPRAAQRIPVSPYGR
jgi:hypothetical protein